MDDDAFAELSPTYVGLTAAFDMGSCTPSQPPVQIEIDYMGLTFFAFDPQVADTTIRDQVLEVFGYAQAHATLSRDQGIVGPILNMWAYDVPAGDILPHEARMLVALERAGNTMLVTVYETSVPGWPELVETFVASASSVRWLGPSGSGQPSPSPNWHPHEPHAPAGAPSRYPTAPEQGP